MKVQSAPNSVCEREYTVPSGGLVPSSKSMQRSYSRCRASVVALALLKMSTKSWYSWSTPERLGLLTGGEANAEQSFASLAWMYSVKFIAPGSLQEGADEGGRLEVGGESRGCDAAEADTGVDSAEGGTGAASIHSVPSWNSMWPNTQSINGL